MNEYRGAYEEHLKELNDEYAYNNLKGDVDCYWHQANNVTANTPTIIHTYGARAGQEWLDSMSAALDRDATCVFPIRMSDPIGVFETVYREALNQTENTNSLILTGHSAGGPTTLKALATMYKEGNVTGEPPLVVMLDGSFVSCKLTPEEKKLLVDNNVPIIAYYQLDSQKIEYESLGKQGLNIALIRDYDCQGHATPSVNFFANEKGLYDFACGKGALQTGTNGLGMSVWSEGNEVYTNAGNYQNISKVDTLDKIYNLFGIDTYATKIQQLKLLNSNTLSNLTFSINNNELDRNLRNVLATIGNTSYVASNFNCDASSGGSSLTLSKIADLTQKYFTTTTDLLLNIANEMQEFTKISPAITEVENKMADRATELNSSVALGVNAIVNNSILTTNTPQKQENTIKNNNSAVTMNNSFKEENLKTSEINNQNTQSGEINKETLEQPIEQNNNNNNYNKTNNNRYHTSNQKVQNNQNPLEQFPEYKEIYSDDTKIVYDYNNEYKIIIHKNGDEIIGIEHYYNFENENAANNALASLKSEYTNSEAIFQKGQYVKVILNEEIYKNLTIADIRQHYSQLHEIIKL